MNLEEFSYQFGVNGAENLISKLNQIERETEDLDNAVQHLGNTFQKFFDLALRSAIPPAFIKMVMDQAMAFSKQAEYIDKLAQTSGMSTRTIQQFGYALHRFGGDVASATMQLDQLQSKLDQFKKPIGKGGGLASELAELAKLHKVDLRGVNSSIDLLKAISVRMEKLSERKKLELAKAFGLDDSTFLMVKNGLKSLEESLYKAQKFVLFDDKEIRQAKEFENTLRDIADNITLISKSFSFGAIPQMQKFANVMRKVTDFMTEHNKVVKGIGLTSFAVGALGIFRLLNFLPTKFLKGAAGVFGGGLALGSIGEEIDKLDRSEELDKLGQKKKANSLRNKTYIGTLEKLGYKETAHYLELIYRAINDLAFNTSLEGLKNLSDKIGKDLGIKSLEKENINKSIDNASGALSEYGDAFKKYGFTGLIARAMTSGDTEEKRIEDFTKNRKEIEDAGGVFSYFWKELKTIFEEIKNKISSAIDNLWTPIFDNINRMLDYLKGIFYDLVIFIKQKTGIGLSESDKAHLLKKQLMSTDNESVNNDIKESSKEIADIISSEISAKKALKSTIDISDIIGNKNINNIDAKNVSLRDFIHQIFPLLSQDETGRALDRFRNVLPEDSLMDALNSAEIGNETKDKGGFFRNIADGITSLLEPFKSTLINRIKVTDEKNSLLKSIESGDKKLENVSFFEVFKEFIKSEWQDIYRNWLSLDKAIENVGKVFSTMANIIDEINKKLEKHKGDIDEGFNYAKQVVKKTTKITTAVTGAKGGAAAGSAIGGMIAGPAGAAAGGLIGGVAGAIGGYIWGIDIIKKYFENDENVKSLKDSLKDKVEDLKDDLNSLQLQLYDADTDIVRDAVFDLIEKKKKEIEAAEKAMVEAQAIVDGNKNLEAMGNQVANSNSPAVNNNSQENVVTINQNINIAKTNESPENISRAVLDGTRNGANQGIRQAAKSRAMGNIN